MKRIIVPEYPRQTGAILPAEISGYMNTLERHRLEFTPWQAYPYKPAVQFSIAHAEDSILIKYFVEEGVACAASGLLNGPVWKDSCVEFFIGFDGNGYYNFEFNCIGNMLGGFRKAGDKPELLPGAVLGKIQSEVLIRNNPAAGKCYWELAAVIPAEVFVHHSIVSLNGMQCRANFYKCGDLLPEPHFVAWSDIVSPQPNFHLPEFFGSLCFSDAAGVTA